MGLVVRVLAAINMGSSKSGKTSRPSRYAKRRQVLHAALLCASLDSAASSQNTQKAMLPAEASRPGAATHHSIPSKQPVLIHRRVDALTTEWSQPSSEHGNGGTVHTIGKMHGCWLNNERPQPLPQAQGKSIVLKRITHHGYDAPTQVTFRQ